MADHFHNLPVMTGVWNSSRGCGPVGSGKLCACHGEPGHRGRRLG